MACISLQDKGTITESLSIGRYTTHQFLVILAIVSTSIALVFSFGQILLHATHYHIPEQQRRINRLLFMVPVYGVSNMLAAIYYQHSVYFDLVGNAYAAIGLASFFNLLYAYVTEGATDPKLVFRRLRPKPWQWPLSWPRRGRRSPLYAVRTPRSGLTWFNICYCGVFQYNFVLLSTCIAGSLASIFGRYCPATLDPRYGYIWVIVINAVSAVVSSYCLTQFYLQVRKEVYKHRASFQFLCIDIVLYLSTFQKLFITILVRFDAIRISPKMQEQDIRVSLPATCLCVEMALVAILHIWAYPLGPYKVWRRPRALENHVVGQTRTYTGMGIAMVALIEMVSVWDLLKGIGRAFKYLLMDFRHRKHEIGYVNQHMNRSAMRSRWFPSGDGLAETLSSEGRSGKRQPTIEVVDLDVKRPPRAVSKQ